MKTLINTALFVLLASLASNSFAADEYSFSPTNGELNHDDVLIDLVLARPLGVVGSGLGLALQGVGLLFSVPGENFSETGEALVEEPLNYTFNRPLGRFDNR